MSGNRKRLANEANQSESCENLWNDTCFENNIQSRERIPNSSRSPTKTEVIHLTFFNRTFTIERGSSQKHGDNLGKVPVLSQESS